MVFAAADPTGGAGIQADMLTLAGMGCHALTVITALTVQDTAGVEDVLAVDADFVSEQARAVCDGTFSIAQFGSTRSINASAAAAIAMHSWVRVHADLTDESAWRG